MTEATPEAAADAILGKEHERAMLAAVWLDLVIHREITEETNMMLSSHFAPQFSATVRGISGSTSKSPRRIDYALQVTPASQIAMVVEMEDRSGKHLRLDVNSKPVRAFLDEARTILLNYLHRAFPKGEVKSSFAYEAHRLITEQEDPK